MLTGDFTLGVTVSHMLMGLPFKGFCVGLGFSWWSSFWVCRLPNWKV